MTQVLSRTGPVEYTDDKDKWVSFKDFLHGKPFYAKKETHRVRMDFDMKRKPIRNSFRTDKVVIEGKMYEIAHFETEPFKNISEFRLYRDKKDLVSVLRTEEDWSKFWLKIDSSSIKAQPRDLNWSILNSCIMGYRMGLWDIPALNGKNVDEKCEWINMHNSSTKKFKTSDWKNARRPERQVNMLPESMIADKLKELVNDMSYSN